MLDHHRRDGNVELTWQLGCFELDGNTARQWLCTMICHYLFLPFYAIIVAQAMSGRLANRLLIHSIASRYNYLLQNGILVTASYGLSILFLPV